MKQLLFTYLFATLIAIVGFQTHSSAQSPPADCPTCGDPGTPNFLLLMETVSITPVSGPTTGATVRVFFENQSTVAANITTVEFSMLYNKTNLPSLTNIFSDAFSGSWIQMTQLFPPAVFVNDAYSDVDFPKTLNGFTYDRHYEYDHSGFGAPHPTQTVNSGVRVEVMTITLTFDGTQTFSSNPADPNYLLSKENMAILPGECIEACPNINNQWGFVDGGGNPLLVNCYRTKSSPFPIELIDFSGVAFPGYNELYWETATEINSEWHIIERSANPDSEDWSEVGRVQAAGESLEPINYSLRDNNPLEISYYRLKAVDFDGSYDYSEIVVLRREVLDDGSFSVYPNPTSSTVIVETAFTSRSDVTVEIVDALGRVISTKVYPDFTGFFQEELNLDYYAPGMYFIRLDNGFNTKEAKVVKQ